MAAEPIEISTSVDFDLDSLFAAAPPPAFDFSTGAPFCSNSAEGAVTGYGNAQGSGTFPEDPTGCFWLEGIERFLLDEEDAGVVAVEDFLVNELGGDSSSADAAIPSGGDSSPADAASPSGGDCCYGEGAGASLNGSAASTASDEGELRQKEGRVELPQGMGGKEGEDPEERRRKRQLRNRDSAMKSRERRKLYVHDLEAKNKYLQSECRHLEYLLQCCTAENLALHQHLQKSRMSGACGAKQESAVLFMIPLLLGSLFWLTSIVYLFLAPNLFAWRLQSSKTELKAKGLAPNPGREIKGENDVRSRERRPGSTKDLVFMRRRCKALRTRIKMLPFGLMFP